MADFQIDPPKMHWENGTPQEQILDFVRTMKRNMATTVERPGLFGMKIDREAQAYVNAYETIEKHIVRYMPFWDKNVKEKN